MKSLFKIFLAVLLLSNLTGCFFSRQEVEEKPEVMVGRDCGMDKFPCCDEEPPCSYAQKCCVDPNDSARNYCSDECTCGNEKEFCCKDEPKCKDGLVCHQGNCAACGKENEPCCNNFSCGMGLSCLQDKCVICGLPGNPCCGGKTCLAEKNNDMNRTECYEGLCRLCGFGGNVACQNEPRCNTGQLLNNEVCHMCGDYNQPCCNESAKTGYDCDPKDNLKCELGFCAVK